MAAKRKKHSKGARHRKDAGMRVVREEDGGYGGSVALHRAPDGSVSPDVRLEKETIGGLCPECEPRRHVRAVCYTNKLQEDRSQNERDREDKRRGAFPPSEF